MMADYFQQPYLIFSESDDTKPDLLGYGFPQAEEKPFLNK